MTSIEAPPAVPTLVPIRAQAEWLALTAVLEECSTVPCRESDPEAWWPDQRDHDTPSTRAALAACRRCPAAAECLAYALSADERFGVWGATLPPERRAMHRYAEQEVV